MLSANDALFLLFGLMCNVQQQPKAPNADGTVRLAKKRKWGGTKKKKFEHLLQDHGGRWCSSHGSVNTLMWIISVNKSWLE